MPVLWQPWVLWGWLILPGRCSGASGLRSCLPKQIAILYLSRPGHLVPISFSRSAALLTWCCALPDSETAVGWKGSTGSWMDSTVFFFLFGTPADYFWRDINISTSLKLRYQLQIISDINQNRMPCQTSTGQWTSKRPANPERKSEIGLVSVYCLGNLLS